MKPSSLVHVPLRSAVPGGRLAGGLLFGLALQLAGLFLDRRLGLLDLLPGVVVVLAELDSGGAHLADVLTALDGDDHTGDTEREGAEGGPADHPALASGARSAGAGAGRAGGASAAAQAFPSHHRS